MVTTTDIPIGSGIWKITAPDHVTLTPPPVPNDPNSQLGITIDYHPSDLFSAAHGIIDLKFEEPAGNAANFGLRLPVQFDIKNSLGVQMEGFTLYLANEDPILPPDTGAVHPMNYGHFHSVNPNTFPGTTLNLKTQDFFTSGAFGPAGLTATPAPGVINATGVIANGATISNQAAPVVLHGYEIANHNDTFHIAFFPHLTPAEVSQVPRPILSLAPMDLMQPEGDSGTTPFTFTVTRSGDTSGAVSVAYAVSGSGAHPAEAADFAGGTLPSGTLSFVAGETSHSIVIPVAGDTTVEPDETFTLALSNATSGARIATGSATGTIRNDDTAPTPHHPDYPEYDEQANGPDDHGYQDPNYPDYPDHDGQVNGPDDHAYDYFALA